MMRRLAPGQSLTATEMNELTRRVMDLDRATGAGSVTVSREAGGFTVKDNSLDMIFARITGAPTGAAYPWVEVVRNSSGGWDDIPGWPGRSGTATVLPAVELTGNTGVATNTIVKLEPLPGGDGWGFVAGGSSSFEMYSGTSLSEFTTTAADSFPSGYAIRSMGSTPLTITDTVRVYFPSTSVAGQLAGVVLACHFNLFVASISGATAGFFVVKGNDLDLGSARYNGSDPMYVAGSSPIVTWRTVTATQDYVDITVNYSAIFYSPAPWGGSGQPTTRFRVCTSAISIFNNNPVDWLRRSSRGSGGVAACPSAVIV